MSSKAPWNFILFFKKYLFWKSLNERYETTCENHVINKLLEDNFSFTCLFETNYRVLRFSSPVFNFALQYLAGKNFITSVYRYQIFE